MIGFDGLYEVSDTGEVRSLPRSHTRGRVLKQTSDPRGYRRVGLSKKARVSTRLVHHLVLESFVGPRGAAYGGLHFDDDPSNNAVGNLSWGTARQNMLDTVRNGNHTGRRKTHCVQGHPYDESNTHWYTWRGTRIRRCRSCLNRWQRQNRQRHRDGWVADPEIRTRPLSPPPGTPNT